jgi:hypothetical protein
MSPGSSNSLAPRGSTTVFGGMIRPQSSAEGPAGTRVPKPAEPQSDSASDAAIKKRIEKQVQLVVGDRVRSVEIRLSGRMVVIRAQAARFWQRRGVRRSLESMPLPAGYRARVEMID